MSAPASPRLPPPAGVGADLPRPTSRRAPPPPRVVFERVSPEIDGGRFPVKRTEGDRVVVEADVFADGHDELACLLKVRREEDRRWIEIPMAFLDNDRWRGVFRVGAPGRYRYTLEGWIDAFRTWRRDMKKWLDAGQDVSVELEIGARLVAAAAKRATGADARALARWAKALRRPADPAAAGRRALDDALAALMDRYADRRLAAHLPRELEIVVERERARFSAWYELFPRSCSPEAGRHGTFRDVIDRLPYVAGMGFDILYLPPIHPIGIRHRKGPNNQVVCRPGDPGSPWAIGSAEGGHTAFHPQLGTREDFRRLVAAARRHGLELALDIAFQCSPDHPWVKRHPDWFRKRPDGTIQYAENPPKKYQDIYPLDFDSADWSSLWREGLEVFRFWLGEGVRVFRVDNPHTKAFAFWEWLIREIQREHPDAIFLAEAFTRPKVMYRLAKLGFSQSYTYFAWRHTAREMRAYLTELTRTEIAEFFRPNFWPNTPDILTEPFQTGGRPVFMARLVLAATLAANYGIYGPAYELGENRPLVPGKEEYLDSEKYQLRHWDLDAPGSLRDLIARVNRARRDHPALQRNDGLVFFDTDNDQLLCYAKVTEDRSDAVLGVVNFDPRHTQAGWATVDPAALGLDPRRPYEVEDLLTGNRYTWSGPRNYVALDPAILPAHLFHVRQAGARA